MDFQTINYDGDLEEADAEELRSIVSRFETAQDENVAEFKAAKEQTQDLLGEDADFEALFGEVTDFTEAKDELVDEIGEMDAFAESPMDEEELRAASFSKVRSWHAHFSALDAEEAPEAEEAEEQEFEDMGQRAETHNEEDEDIEFAEKYIGDLPGVNFQ